ncbi:MAG: hypothetical protein ABR591_10685 [Candidatus Velthaea sp.]
MSIPVNLYVDRLSMTPPARAADVYAATSDHSALYSEAAKRIGLTPSEYREFRADLSSGRALYVKLPRRLNSMAGVHHGNGKVYALNNVVIPAGVMGWQVSLSDGTQVYVPKVCGNLSMIRPVAIATKPAPRTRTAAVAFVRPPAPPAAPVVAAAQPSTPETPVTFAPLDSPAVVAPVVPVAAAAAGPHLGLAGLLIPIVGLLTGGGGGNSQPGGAPPAGPITPPDTCPAR